MFNNFNGLFFRTLSYPYLNPTFILLCKVSAGKGLQSSIALWKWYFSLFALDLLQDYFIRKPYPMKWENWAVTAHLTPSAIWQSCIITPSALRPAVLCLGTAMELYNPHGTNAHTCSYFCWHTSSSLSFLSTPPKFHRWVQLWARFLSAATPRANGTFLVNKTNS